MVQQLEDYLQNYYKCLIYVKESKRLTTGFYDITVYIKYDSEVCFIFYYNENLSEKENLRRLTDRVDKEIADLFKK